MDMTAAPSFEITPAHAAIFDWVSQLSPSTKAALIEAVAGSGKTATLIQVLMRIPTAQSVIFLAFGKEPAREVAERAAKAGLDRANVAFKTLNGLGYGPLRRRFGSDVDEDVVDARLEAKLDPKEFRLLGGTVRRLMAAAKSQGLVPAGIPGTTTLLPDTADSWRFLIDRFDIDPPADDEGLLSRAITIARRALRAGLLDLSKIDFDDQLYATLAWGLPLPRWDWVLVDEAQDLNPVQREILGRVMRKGGRLIAVGDRHQAIYGFRGADSASLGKIAAQYGAKSFPLSITYRCPKAVVALAQEYVPHLQAAATAPEGTVETIKGDLGKVDWLPTDMVICRNNAPLIQLAYRLIRAKIPCVVLGRDIGQGLLALTDRLRPADLVDLLAKLDRFHKREREKLEASGAKESKVQILDDKVATLRIFAEESDTLDDMRAAIGAMFADKDQGRLTLSSVHKAKGLERPRIFILNRHLMPSKMARSAMAIEQERNLIYVALTRARMDLRFINLADQPAAA